MNPTTMTRLFLIFACLLLIIKSNGQTLDPIVFVASGNISAGKSVKLDWVIGSEKIMPVLTISSITIPTNQALNIAVYPNPTNELVTIDVHPLQDDFPIVEFFDVHGKES
jgi:hypothetical protein